MFVHRDSSSAREPHSKWVRETVVFGLFTPEIALQVFGEQKMQITRNREKKKELKRHSRCCTKIDMKGERSYFFGFRRNPPERNAN